MVINSYWDGGCGLISLGNKKQLYLIDALGSVVVD